MRPYFKTGSDLNIPIRIIGATASSIQSCVRVKSNWRLIGEFTASQEGDYTILSIPAATTATWQDAVAVMDIKVAIDGKIKHSETYEFDVKRSVKL